MILIHKYIVYYSRESDVNVNNPRCQSGDWCLPLYFKPRMGWNRVII